MVEQARYEVTGSLGKLELRRYPPMMVARVDGMGDGGFGPLFRYISGDNRQRSRIEMTAPVIASPSEKIAMTAPVMAEGDSIAFVMPHDMSLRRAPEPLDPRVVVEEVPERTVAVLRFSGRWTQAAFRRRSRELLDAIEVSGVRTMGQVFSMRYNPPFTLPFLRRNEVAIEIDPTPV